MAEQRTPREKESRTAEERPSDSWVPASILPNPKPVDGWVFRWIRTSTLGKADNTNVSQKFREGWIPVKAEDHPELEVMSDIDSRFSGNLEIGGLLLCKAPKDNVSFIRLRTRRKVDLPQPDGPMKAVTWPVGTSIETLSIACFSL